MNAPSDDTAGWLTPEEQQDMATGPSPDDAEETGNEVDDASAAATPTPAPAATPAGEAETDDEGKPAQPAPAPAPGDKPNEGGDEPAPAPAPAAEQPAPAEAPAADAEGENQSGQDTRPTETPVEDPARFDKPLVDHFEYVRPAPENYEQTAQQLNEKLDELARQYDDPNSEMDFATYQRQSRELQQQLNSLEVANRSHLDDVRTAQQRLQNDMRSVFTPWAAWVKANGGPDYNADAEFPQFQAAMGFAEQTLRAQGKPITIKGLYDAAHRSIMAARGLNVAPAPAPGANTPPPTAPRPGPRADPPRPMTLANMPAAAPAPDGANPNPFAAFDTMDDVEREEAFARMSPAEQQRYLESG